MGQPAKVLPIFEKVEEFVKSKLDEYHPSTNVSEKSIRDAVWGTLHLYPWEVAIMDSPLIQRLRDIRQTGLAYLVYPTAQHSRFDHTLGMTTVVSRIVGSINEKTPLEDLKISHADHYKLRMSALLHDVGHSVFSHVSESVYKSSEEFSVIIKYINDNYHVTPKPHEILSWFIVRSRRFKTLIADLRKKRILKGWECKDRDIDEIANNIIGYREKPEYKFQTDIINGAMDADKLDYLVRDAYFAGPPVVYDLDRFLRTIEVISPDCEPAAQEQQAERQQLGVSLAGVTALEQIILSKLMMYSYVYHHQKIRCAHAMCQEALSALAELARQKGKTDWKSVLPWLGDACAFLEVSDRSLFPHALLLTRNTHSSRIADEILGMLAARRLYKRALIISRLFIVGVDSDDEIERFKVDDGFRRFLSLRKNPARLLKLRHDIFVEAKTIMNKPNYKTGTKDLVRHFQEHHVLIDIPKMPDTEEVRDVSTQVTHLPNSESKRTIPLSSFFPIGAWVDTYNAIKWRAHIFSVEDAAPYVSSAAVKVLSEKPFNLDFAPEATDLCKLNESVKA